MADKYQSIELVRVAPDVLSRARFGKFIGNDNDGYINIQGKQGSKKRKLLVVAPATHAARLTSNNALYQPRRMFSDIQSFVHPYPKPVLVEHESKLPPIGRVVQASYESIPHHFLQDPAEHFDEKDTFRLIKHLMSTGLLYNDDFPGVGQAILNMEITDEQSIERFLDQRYLTFSIRVASNEILDPHTGLPFAEFGQEPEEGKHSPYHPGQVVDGLPGFVVLDRMKYKEVSPVNMPADEHAIVRSIQEMSFSDSEQSIKKPNSYKVDGSYVIELISNQLGAGDKMPNDKVLEDNKNASDANKKEDKPKEPLSFDHITDQSSADEIYDALSLILDEMTQEGILKEDAKLTTEARKSLPGSSFCGPGRSFPVPDCSHVTAARRLIDRAKLSSSQKARVLGCVDRKAKNMNCDGDSCTIVTADSIITQIQDFSDFDFITIVDSVINSLKDRGISLEDSATLSEFVDKSGGKNPNKLLDAKIKELESEKNVLSSQIDSLTTDVKNYVSLSNVLMKVFKDNIKIQSLEDAVNLEKTSELLTLKQDAEKLVKDEVLIKRVQDYLAGLTNASNVTQDSKLNSPVQDGPNVKTDNNDSWIEKMVRAKFESFKLSDGEQAATSYLEQLVASDYITKAFSEELSKKSVNN